MKGMTAMYDHKWKKWGFVISGIALAAMIAERIRPYVLLRKLNPEQNNGVFQWVMLFGLFIVIYSKEKYDDDRAKAIRLKAFQIAFALQQAVILGMAFSGSVNKDPMNLVGQDLYVFGAIGIIFYLLIFHVGLYFDFLWDYNDSTVWENLRNMRKNGWAKLVYLLIAAITMFAMTLFGTR